MQLLERPTSGPGDFKRSGKGPSLASEPETLEIIDPATGPRFWPGGPSVVLAQRGGRGVFVPRNREAISGIESRRCSASLGTPRGALLMVPRAAAGLHRRASFRLAPTTLRRCAQRRVPGRHRARATNASIGVACVGMDERLCGYRLAAQLGVWDQSRLSRAQADAAKPAGLSRPLAAVHCSAGTDRARFVLSVLRAVCVCPSRYSRGASLSEGEGRTMRNIG